MKRRQILFTGLRRLEVANTELPPLGADQVLVHTEISLISTGTENICFNRLFEPGTHYDRWVKYPFEPGYSTIGIAEAIGPDVKLVKVGDRVAHQKGHASHHVVDEGRCFVVPSSVPPEHAVWFALAQVGYCGARRAGFRLGDRVVVIGAGPVGQVTLRWAIASGAEETLVIDTMQRRLDIAAKGGTTYALAASVSVDSSESEEWAGGAAPEDTKALVSGTTANAKVEELLGGLPDVVVEATGHPSVFQAALGLVKTEGRLLLLGDTGTPGEQRLTADLLTRSITIHGAHGEISFHDRDWNGVAQLFFRLVSSGRFSLEGMNTHWFSPEDAEDAYRLANERRGETMGIIFRW